MDICCDEVKVSTKIKNQASITREKPSGDDHEKVEADDTPSAAEVSQLYENIASLESQISELSASYNELFTRIDDDIKLTVDRALRQQLLIKRI